MSKKKAGLSANAKWGIAFLVEIVVMLFMVLVSLLLQILPLATGKGQRLLTKSNKMLTAYPCSTNCKDKHLI